MATRWGIAGAGKVSHDFVTALATLPKSEHRVLGVAARDLSRAKKFAELHKIEEAYGNYKELSENKDIEIVYIGVLNLFHLEIAKMMLNAGKHVLCETPLTISLKQTSELINLAKSKGLFLMEALWSRCLPTYVELKKELDLECVGEVNQIIIFFGFNETGAERMFTKELGGGVIFEYSATALHLVSLVFGREKPESVTAMGNVNKNGSDTSMSAILKFKNNRTATIVFNSQVDFCNDAFIIGSKGTIKIPQTYWCLTKIEFPHRVVEITLPKGDHEFNYPNGAGLRFEAVEVRSCLLKGLKESPRVPHADSLYFAELEDEFRKQLSVVYNAD